LEYGRSGYERRGIGIVCEGRSRNINRAGGIERDGRNGAVGVEVGVNQRALRRKFGHEDTRLLGRVLRAGIADCGAHIHGDVGVSVGVDRDAGRAGSRAGEPRGTAQKCGVQKLAPIG
jgi:hypothetical protein